MLFLPLRGRSGRATQKKSVFGQRPLKKGVCLAIDHPKKEWISFALLFLKGFFDQFAILSSFFSEAAGEEGPYSGPNYEVVRSCAFELVSRSRVLI